MGTVDFPSPAVLVVALCLPALMGCRRAASRAAGLAAPVRFVDAAARAGLRFRHTSGRSGRYLIAETLGAGCACLDYDGDGRLDLFLCNSSRLPGYPGKGPFYPALYQNEGNGKFHDVTRAAGLAIDCYGMGAAVGDYDNDGDPDLLLASYGGSHLFRNDQGHFIEVTKQAGVEKPAWGTSAAWFDADRDGALDLFVCSYVNWTPEKNQRCGEEGRRSICGPSHYPGTASMLYHNNRDGTFSDVTKRAGVYNPNGKALGVVVWDMDDDGWPDLAVANDTEPNWLFHNNRDGTFSETGVEAGIAYGPEGRLRAGMGIDTADWDHSGREAILIGNLSGEGLAFFQPSGAPTQFEDAAKAVGLFQASLPFTTFGARFLDVDLDGFADVMTANGHVREDVARHAGVFDYRQRLQLFHNEPADGADSLPAGSPRATRCYRDITALAGPGLDVPRVGRGLAVGDYDEDGDPDVLVNVNNGAPLLLENQGAPRGHWLAVKPVGRRSNREGIGARVRVTAGGQTQSGWVRSGGSYGSEDERVARFGLGGLAQADGLEVRWPSGAVDRLHAVRADRVLVVREGQSDPRWQ